MIGVTPDIVEVSVVRHPDTLYERVRTGVWPDEHVAA